jgi:ribosomal protein L7/L12
MDLLSAPMDLSAFESKVSASGIMRAVSAPVADSGSDGSGDGDGSLCAVSIGKSANPKVHQLVSEVLGVSMQEASRLCQKPILTIAKDVSMADAQNMKQQFAAVGVVAKIASRRL